MSAERVYRAGRDVAIPALSLQPGERVLDVGCGTGLNLLRLAGAVGTTGRVVGLDLSPQMLDVARGKVTRGGLDHVDLVLADATRVGDAPELAASGPFDALIATYALSLMDDLEAAWGALRGLLAPGARVAVVDLQPPSGLARLADPLARVACLLGGADIHARPWRRVEQDLTSVRSWSLRGGHVQVRVGRWTPPIEE